MPVASLCRMQAGGRVLAVALTVVSGAGSAACAGSQRQTSFIAGQGNVKASTSEVRVEAFELGRVFSREIESAADRILQESEDPSVRMAALLWKVNGIPIVQTAALSPDPLISGIDLSALAGQMRDFFQNGRGREVMGVHADVAVVAMNGVIRSAEASGERISKTGTLKLRGEVDEWIAAHPIEDFHFRRESIPAAFASALRSEGGGPIETLDLMEAAMSRLDLRVAMLDEWMPKLARWNAQLMVSDALRIQGIDTTMSSLNETMASANETMANANGLMTGLPGLIAHEREAAISALHQERLDAQAELGARLDTSRGWLNDAVNQQREIVVKDVDRMVAQRGRALVDYVLLRALQVMVGMGLLVGAFFLIRHFLRRRTSKVDYGRRATDTPRRRATDFEPRHAH